MLVRTNHPDGTVTVTGEAASPVPAILTKTQFMDHVIAQLVATLSIALDEAFGRFTEIMEAAKTSTDAKVRFAYARYEAAQTLEKTNTATLTQFMVDDTTTGHLTATERTAVLDNWP